MKFNPEQKKIIDHIQGPLAVLANPGTGKTRSITERTVKLIKDDYAKDKQILSITFTNKARNEMRERLEERLGKNRVNIYTFHGFGSRLIREFGDLIDINPNFTIIDDQPILSYLKKEWAASFNFPDFKISSLFYLIADAANYNETFSSYLESKTYSKNLKKAIEQTQERYEKWKKKNNVLDLGDLQRKALDVIRAGAKEKLKQRYKFIMVDEFQDTNQIQLEIIKEIAEHKNIVIVGDMRQCIYAWRGAEPRNVQYFIDHFSAPIINLSKNYRSCTEIVKTYNNLIANSKINLGAPTQATTEKTGIVKNFIFDDDYREVEGVLKLIKELRTKVKCKYDDIAILYRTNALSKQFEDAFHVWNIPYQLIGSKSFYDRREVREFLSLFKWLYNPNDLMSLINISKMAKCGVGEKGINSVFGTYFGDEEIQFEDLEKIIEKLPPKQQKFFQFLLNLRNSPLNQIADKFLDEYKVISRLQVEDKKKNETRADNIISIQNNLTENSHWTLEEFLEIYCVEREEDDPDDTDGIYLMTIHKSKGLEFRAVILVGFDEKLLPHEMGMNTEDELEEERRAAYVALSRAKEFLVISSAKFRKLTYNKEFTPSRFLGELNL